MLTGAMPKLSKFATRTLPPQVCMPQPAAGFAVCAASDLPDNCIVADHKQSRSRLCIASLRLSLLQTNVVSKSSWAVLLIALRKHLCCATHHAQRRAKHLRTLQPHTQACIMTFAKQKPQHALCLAWHASKALRSPQAARFACSVCTAARANGTRKRRKGDANRRHAQPACAVICLLTCT